MLGKGTKLTKKFFEITNVLNQMIKSTSILLKNFFLKKIQFDPFSQHSPQIISHDIGVGLQVMIVLGDN